MTQGQLGAAVFVGRYFAETWGLPGTEPVSMRLTGVNKYPFVPARAGRAD